MFIAQIVANGLLLGGILACVALGFSLIWGVLNVINITHGALVMIGAFLSFFLFSTFKIDPFLTIPISMVVLFLVGLVIQLGLLNQVIRAPVLMTFLLTFGLQILFINLGLIFFSPNFRMINLSYGGVGLNLGGVVIPATRLGTLVIALVITGLLTLFMDRTKLGNAIRATGMDIEAARLMGVNIRWIYGLTYAIGAALAGAAGALVSANYSISPNQTAEAYTLTGFVIVALGGLGSVPGALIGALLYGVIQSLSVVFIGSGYQNAVAFVVLVLVLIFRPNGLFGSEYTGTTV